MKTIVVTSAKGGVGKSTTACTLAALLAGTGKRTLLIDLDAQANSTYMLTESRPHSGITAVMQGKARAVSAIIKTRVPGLDLLGSDASLSSLEESLLTAPGRDQRLKLAVKGLKYDFIIMDTSPHLGVLTLNAYAAANFALIPANVGAFAFEAVKATLEAIKETQRFSNKALKVAGIVPTMYRTGKNPREFLESLQIIATAYGCRVTGAVIPQCNAVSDAELDHKLLTECKPSKALESYQHILKELLAEAAPVKKTSTRNRKKA